MLDESTREYIWDYYQKFMTAEEHAALLHYEITYRFGERIKRDGPENQPEMIRSKISKDPAVLALLEEGFQQFITNTIERIYRESADKIFFNKCPQCGKLARTPEAKQCRYCGFSWHGKDLETGKYKEVGKFKIAGAFQIIDGLFYIVGDVVSGEIKKGLKVNLTVLSLTIRPDITDVESIAYRGDGNLRQATALAISIKSEADKEFLKTKSPFEQPVPVEE
ncbi:hypothetical protein A4D02_00105 [Niastella koreensis]|uniref:Uncharacterized protein n=2 Tax=Niastella koreensis TaxID=354356 RepID=G8TA16_NIAKG|nr:hypothetical protein [Niastella koreensis]AEW02388.1 hypothetical protein Niako_6163 [Niastella koreensis GR20-10]OQP54767.1 hypothetical protein A4D02_00105 [Niastella koreensis]